MFSTRCVLATCLGFVTLIQATVVSSVSGQDSTKGTAVTSKTVTSAQLDRYHLEEVVVANYENVTNYGSVKDPFVNWSLKYTALNNGKKETFDWSLAAQVVEIPKQARTVRVWFRCIVMPANPDIEKLQQILFQSGQDPHTRAYFRIFDPTKETRELALVLDVPADDVSKERFPDAINGLLDFAHKTIYLWGDMEQPLPQGKVTTESKPTSKEVKLDQLAGFWKGDANSDSKKVAEWSLKMEKDGFFLLTRADFKVSPPKMQILTGQAKIAEAKLNLTFHAGQKTEIYEVDLQQDKLTLVSGEGKTATKVELAK